MCVDLVDIKVVRIFVQAAVAMKDREVKVEERDGEEQEEAKEEEEEMGNERLHLLASLEDDAAWHAGEISPSLSDSAAD